MTHGKNGIHHVAQIKIGMEQGITLIEIMVSLAIAAIIGVSMMIAMETIYQDRTQSRILTSRIIDTAIMKQALNATATTAGALVTSPTPSATSATPSASSGNFFSQIWNIIGSATMEAGRNFVRAHCKSAGMFCDIRSPAKIWLAEYLPARRMDNLPMRRIFSLVADGPFSLWQPIRAAWGQHSQVRKQRH